MRTIILLLLTTTILSAQNDHYDLYQKKVFETQNGNLLYRIMYPKNFSEDKQYPVVLFLHGSGERGSDNTKQLIHGSSLFASEDNREKFPAIVVFPQCPMDTYWSNMRIVENDNIPSRQYDYTSSPPLPLQNVMDLMDELLSKEYTDNNRVYIAGLSMGGMGTFEMLYRRPDIFAAAVPICGGGNADMVDGYAKKVSVWIFHGAKDNIVDPKNSLDIAKGILGAGGYPMLTLFEDANHNSWDPAFAHPGLLEWMFSKSK
ncbi:prolyl oligopeptidase family serine peptidase [Mangrovivirga sp. M17]|uniref:Prolyl oligopeptidase family serine peptidase n=1 Tax=Mangrovivirga halotolerans TaxID=2993936 RepID=A0ABT3RMX2_9BACT|nr:prolyl oligopeptidase family serine peptidase [Mangrovivirga halotolerans]MCX2742719.1 prolyl oligopeptidase family serine peptidase [Mangrovivirga halotolerans]